MTSASRCIAPGCPGRCGGSRRKMSGSPLAVNDHVSRDAPPVSLPSAAISTGAPSAGASAAARPSDTDAGADRDVIDDLVEILRQPRAFAAVDRPAGQALGEAGDPAPPPGGPRGARRNPPP